MPPSARPDPRPLVLASGLTTDQVATLLAPYGFRDTKRADDNIQAIAGDPSSRALLARILGSLLDAVATSADPDQALIHWERFLSAGIARTHLFDYLRGAPRMLHLLCTIFGNCSSLAQTLIRDPLLVYWLVDEQVLTRRPSRRDLQEGLKAALGNVSAVELKLEALRRFRRREMLRIGVRDLLRLSDVVGTTVALSDLAAVLIQGAYEVVSARLRRLHGVPQHRDRRGRWAETGFSVIAMGKLGGGELNFSSDVDLIYVYGSDEGGTRPVVEPSAKGFRSIPNEEYFEYLARDLTRALMEATQEGYVFRVDLRLRAEGSVGRLARPLAGYAQYYRARGQVWERLALLKAWPVAGDATVGRAFLRAVRPFVLGLTEAGRPPESPGAVIEQVKAVKQMIDVKMADRGQAQRNVKLGIGGIREIEFLVQTIQVLCGGTLPVLLDRHTLGALARFRRCGLLSPGHYEDLVGAYLFLRDVEHKLQMVHDLQTHALPASPEELTQCAIRLGYSPENRETARKRFLADHRRHTANVRRAFHDLFHARERSRLLRTALKLAGQSGRVRARR